MRNPRDVCHVAIPCWDLDQAFDFYVTRLGCKYARRYADRITLDFFGDQLVCHLSVPPEVEAPVRMYPRHFGVTFYLRRDFDALIKVIQTRGIEFFAEPGLRFEGMPEVHWTMAIVDPAHNVIEFKHYLDPRMMY